MDTLGDLLDEEKSGKLVLPDFQREFVWDINQQRNLIATVLVRIPISSLLILEGKKGDFAEKVMCMKRSFVTENHDCEKYYLLDGQQRLSTMKNCFSNIYSMNTGDKDWKEIFKNIDNGKLKYRWFLRVEADEADVFGLKYLKFPQGTEKAINRLDPSELVDKIVALPVLIKNENEWYSPKSKPGKFKSDSAAQNLVPLFYLHEKSGTVHDVLNKIAEMHCDNLKEGWSQLAIDFKEGILANREHEKEWLNSSPAADDIEWNEFWKEASETWTSDIFAYLQGIMTTKIQQIILKNNELSRAVVIFENLNKSGTALSTYDLLVARAAKYTTQNDLPSLTKMFEKIIQDNISVKDAKADGRYDAQIVGILESGDNISKNFKNAYIVALSVIMQLKMGSSFKKTALDRLKNEVLAYIRRQSILKLESKEIYDYTHIAVMSCLRAITFLTERCGIIRLADLNYRLMLLPISYMMQYDDVWNNPKAWDKIEYWYWSSIFSGRYITNQNLQASEDVVLLYDFIKGSEHNPFKGDAEKILKRELYSDLDMLLQPEKVSPAVKDGIASYVLSKEPHDFIDNNGLRLKAADVAKGNKHDDESLKLELHHIIPLGTAYTNMKEASEKLRKDSGNILNSPLNLTYISRQANKKIGAQSPSEYLKKVYSGAVQDHFIPLDKMDINNPSEPEKFLKARYNMLVDEIKNYMASLAD